MVINYPDWLFKNTWIYHITPIDNLDSIIESGNIYSTNNLTCTYCSIANSDIQQKRSHKNVEIEPYGTLHDYVPFYFAPRSPMLYVNKMGGILNACKQEDIVHLVSYAELVAGRKDLKFVIYDKHPLVNYSSAYRTIEGLKYIDWEIFFEPELCDGYSKYWQSSESIGHPKWLKRGESRQAAFLVYKQFPWVLIQKVGTIDDIRGEKVKAIFNKHGVSTHVETKRGWYY